MRTLLLTVDALRTDHLAPYGYDRDTMPILDYLINESVFYKNCFTNGTHTKLSIPSFMTSKVYGTENFKNGPTIASILAENDIHTAGFHSNTAIIHHFGEIAGFSYYEDFTETKEWDVSDEETISKQFLNKAIDFADETLPKDSWIRSFHRNILPLNIQHTQTPYINADSMNERVLEWIRNHKAEDYFLWVHYMDPHRPYGITPETPQFANDVDDAKIQHLMSKASKRPSSITEEERKLIIDLYDSDLYYLSERLWELVSGLRSEGIWSDLNFILCADHGEEFGEHGYYFHGNKPYDELIRTPLIHKRPDAKSATSDSLHSLIELGPTILDYYNVSSPAEFEGETLTKSDDQGHITAVGKNPETNAVSVCIRTKRWKLIRTGDDIELYDILNDPDEKDDVSDIESSTAASLKRLMPLNLFDVDPSHPDPSTVTGSTRERLKNLGYLE